MIRRAALLGILAAAFAWGPLRARAESFPQLADRLLSTAPFSGASVGALFVSLEDGTTLYSRNPDLPLVPASLAKLATSAAALDALKPDFRFKTSFLVRRKDRGRSSVSVLVWRGDGDPSISGRGRSGLFEIFDVWGSSLAALGIKKIGRIVLDTRAFEGPATVPSWPPQELSYWYSAETSPITFNDDCVDLHFRPGSKVGRRAVIEPNPDFGYIKVRNRTTTLPAGSPFTLDYRRETDGNDVEFFGGIGAADGARTDYVAVHEPALFAAHALRAVWKSRGLKVRRKAIYWEKAGLKDAELDAVLDWTSPPLAEIVKVVNKNSQNLYAEQVLKAMGRRIEGRGSFDAGLAVVRRFLERAGLSAGDFRLLDGSGLSPDDRLSASGLIKILAYARKAPFAREYYDSLAIPGVDKQALTRMKGDPLASGMRLKRGTVAGARNLAGFITSAGGRLYAFAALVNGPALDRPAVDEALDKLCEGAARLLP